MESMYRLSISNFLTIENMSIDLSPGVQGFVGRNAAGKTNILTAIESILSGKHDKKLIKDGEKRSEIRLEEISDGEVVRSVSRIQTEQNSRLEGKGLGNAETPKRWLTTLLDEIAINPIRLISEDPVKYLKKHLPTKVKPEEVVEVSGMDINFNIQANNFGECSKAAEDIGIERRAQYKIMRHAQEIVDELRMNLPPRPEAPKKKFEEIQDEIVAVRAAKLGVKEKNSHRDTLINEVKEVHGHIDFLKDRKEEDKKRIIYLDQELLNNEQRMKDEIAQIKQKYAEMSADLSSKKSAVAQRIEVDEDNVARFISQVKEKEIVIDNTPRLSEEKFETEELRLKAEQKEIADYNSILDRYKHLNQKDQEFQNHKNHYDHLDDAYKYYAYELPKRLVNRANLPVDGLEFRDQELYVSGRHIDRLSSAERHLVAVNLAVSLAEMKGHIAVCVDGVEIMDSEKKKDFLDAIKNRGLKVIYTRHGQPENEFEVEVN